MQTIHDFAEKTTKDIETFAKAAVSLFFIGQWEWCHLDGVPEQEDIQIMCIELFRVCEDKLRQNPQQPFTVASTGRITCNLTRNESPRFTLDITPRSK